MPGQGPELGDHLRLAAAGLQPQRPGHPDGRRHHPVGDRVRALGVGRAEDDLAHPSLLLRVRPDVPGHERAGGDRWALGGRTVFSAAVPCGIVRCEIVGCRVVGGHRRTVVEGHGGS